MQAAFMLLCVWANGLEIDVLKRYAEKVRNREALRFRTFFAEGLWAKIMVFLCVWCMALK